MKTALLSVLLMLATCNAGPAGQKAQLADPHKGELLFWAPGHKGWETIAVTLLRSGRLEVFINPAEIYQDATDSGPSFLGPFRLTTRWVEVVRGLPPAAIMESRGWRDPWARFSYPFQIFPGVGAYKMPNPQSGIDSELRVFQRDANSFLVVIVQVDRVYEAGLAIEAGGMEQ
jgi:hypothetical protein